MTKQTIAVGSAANDGTGDTLRIAGQKINGNFDELYAAIARLPYPLYQNHVAASHTGDTLEHTFVTIPLPGGAVGPNGSMEIITEWSLPNSANTKTTRVKLGGIAFQTLPLTTSLNSLPMARIANRGSQSSQIGGLSAAAASWGSSSAAAITASIDTSIAQNITITGQLANSGETLTLESVIVKIFPGA